MTIASAENDAAFHASSLLHRVDSAINREAQTKPEEEAQELLAELRNELVGSSAREVLMHVRASEIEATTNQRGDGTRHKVGHARLITSDENFEGMQERRRKRVDDAKTKEERKRERERKKAEREAAKGAATAKRAKKRKLAQKRKEEEAHLREMRRFERELRRETKKRLDEDKKLKRQRKLGGSGGRVSSDNKENQPTRVLRKRKRGVEEGEGLPSTKRSEVGARTRRSRRLAALQAIQ